MSADELKKLVGNKKLIIGTEKTLKELKKGTLKMIFTSSNCPKDIKETIEANAKILKVEVSKLNMTNEEMGVIVKKPFAVSVASVLK